jgi:hypothetical protein
MRVIDLKTLQPKVEVFFVKKIRLKTAPIALKRPCSPQAFTFTAVNAREYQ